MGKVSPSSMIGSLSGSAGDRVVARTRGGLATRAKPRYRYPKNAAVQQGNARLKAANAAWNAMTVAQAEAWNRYAAELPLKTAFDGSRYATTGKNALVALTTKFLQANPGAPVPLDPPAGRFLPPSVVVSVTPLLSSLDFTASGPVPPGTVVELLIQPLVTPKRSPTRFYKSAAFVAFPAGSLTYSILLPAGWYACAYRFVERATGRSLGMVALGKVEVA